MGVRRIAATRAEGMSPSVALRENVWTPGESILAQPSGYQAYALVASCSFTTASCPSIDILHSTQPSGTIPRYSRSML